MRKVTYLAVFEPSGTGYGVYFPDLLGCTSYGDTFETAQKEAADALALHIYGLEKPVTKSPHRRQILLSTKKRRRDIWFLR